MCPITKSAKKALRQSKKRRQRNLRRLSIMRENIKKVRKLVEENKKEEALKLLPQTYKAIDKAAKTNVIKKNTAARKKSRLTKMIQSSSAKASGDEPKGSPEKVPEQS